LDAVFNALSYTWSTGDTTRIIGLKKEDYPADSLFKVYLDMNYLGCIFTDTIRVRFVKTADVKVTPGEYGSVKLVNTTVRDELSLYFDKAGLYDCWFYDLKGREVMKTTLLVNTGHSLYTLNVSDLPVGMGMIRVNKGDESYSVKFIKIK
jgi:hypothetical protein